MLREHDGLIAVKSIKTLPLDAGKIHVGLARAQLPTTHPKRSFVLPAVELAQLSSAALGIIT